LLQGTSAITKYNCHIVRRSDFQGTVNGFLIVSEMSLTYREIGWTHIWYSPDTGENCPLWRLQRDAFNRTLINRSRERSRRSRVGPSLYTRLVNVYYYYNIYNTRICGYANYHNLVYRCIISKRFENWKNNIRSLYDIGTAGRRYNNNRRHHDRYI